MSEWLTRPAPDEQLELPPQAEGRIMKAFHDRQYRETLDEPIAMLDGKSPRAAAAGTARKPLEPFRVVAQHPVAQDLKRHALRPRRLRARSSIHDHRAMIIATARARQACFASPQRFARSWSSSELCSVKVIGVAAPIIILHPSYHPTSLYGPCPARHNNILEK